MSAINIINPFPVGEIARPSGPPQSPPLNIQIPVPFLNPPSPPPPLRDIIVLQGEEPREELEEEEELEPGALAQNEEVGDNPYGEVEGRQNLNPVENSIFNEIWNIIEPRLFTGGCFTALLTLGLIALFIPGTRECMFFAMALVLCLWLGKMIYDKIQNCQ